MRFLRPAPVPYDPIAWLALPLPARARQVCQAWALQGYGAPLAIYLVHVVKVGLYVAGWIGWCRFTPGLGAIGELPRWWLAPVAFQKAILWSMLFEGLGLGCGFGPLTGRYVPPFGGALYFLRPGTTKAALAPGWPVIGGPRRSWLDVGLYAAVVALLVAALASAAPAPGLLAAIVGVTLALGACDRTVFLALRAEHYATTLAVIAYGDDWIAGAKAVQLALWFWAGCSKLNHHFATVVCVMVSNSPVLRWGWLRRRLYRSFPDDLRPSALATAMAHAGTALELAVPVVLAIAPGGDALVVGLVLALVLHTFITSNVPLGVPIEWNVMVVYGAFALFWAHPAVGLAAIPAPVAIALAVVLVGVPLVGNLAPSRVSFLVAMRYYAGNWPYGVWLFRGDSYRKLDRLTKPTPWLHDQLARFYDRPTAVGMLSKVMGFRMMHLQGRALPELLPRAVDDLAAYEYVDGEVIAGLALGWNFGDGHLHRAPLLAAIQAQCGFEPGELRCIFVESQPLGGRTLAYQLHDAATGELARGELAIAALRARQPWAGPAPDAR